MINNWKCPGLLIGYCHNPIDIKQYLQKQLHTFITVWTFDDNNNSNNSRNDNDNETIYEFHIHLLIVVFADLSTQYSSIIYLNIFWDGFRS